MLPLCLDSAIIVCAQCYKQTFFNVLNSCVQAIFMIEGLEELDISENDILFIPPAVSKLPNLTTLIINKNCKSLHGLYRGSLGGGH